MPFPAKLTRARILEAALAEIAQQGPAGLSLRSLAGRLGVAPNALYRYFPDRESVLAAAGDAGIQAVMAAMAAITATPAHPQGAAASLQDGSGAADWLGAMAAAYLDFAAQNPALYAAMIARYDGAAAGFFTAHAQLWQSTQAMVAQLSGSDPADPAVGEAAVAIWSYLHGLALLRQSGILSLPSKRQGDPARAIAALLQIARPRMPGVGGGGEMG